MARPQYIAEQFRIALRGTQEQIRQNLIATAKREHARIMSSPPKPGTFRRFVDGREGAVEDTVKAGGFIRYVYPRLDQVVRSAMLTLIDKSPFYSGEYIRGHRLFVDGVFTDWRSDWFRLWKPGQEIAIANFVEYARVIELNRHPRYPNWKVRVLGTSHVYMQAEQILKRKFGNIARIRFTFRGIVGGGNGGMIGGRSGNQSDLRWPALIITEK